MTLPLVVILILVALFLLTRSNKTKRPPITQGVRFLYSPGMSTITKTTTGYRFDMPASPDVQVHYIAHDMAAAGTIRMQGTLTDGPFVPQGFPDREPRMYAMLQRKGDTGTATGAYEGYRWFSLAHAVMSAGEVSLSVPLSPEHWKSINGVNDPAQFAATLRELDFVALVCGSDGGRGHGVYAMNPSSFSWTLEAN